MTYIKKKSHHILFFKLFNSYLPPGTYYIVFSKLLELKKIPLYIKFKTLFIILLILFHILCITIAAHKIDISKIGRAHV